MHQIDASGVVARKKVIANYDGWAAENTQK